MNPGSACDGGASQAATSDAAIRGAAGAGAIRLDRQGVALVEVTAHDVRPERQREASGRRATSKQCNRPSRLGTEGAENGFGPPVPFSYEQAQNPRNAWTPGGGPNGTLHIVWEWRHPGTLTSYADVGYIRSTDGGQTWSEVGDVSKRSGAIQGAASRAVTTPAKGARTSAYEAVAATSAAIASAREWGALAVEMEAAALYAFAAAKGHSVICFAHVTNQMGTVEGDFEKGEAQGSQDALHVVMATVNTLLTPSA